MGMLALLCHPGMRRAGYKSARQHSWMHRQFRWYWQLVPWCHVAARLIPFNSLLLSGERFWCFKV